jgi:membrane-associated phospholipid phosphatase
VNVLIVAVAQYLLFGMALLAGLAWLTLDRGGKLQLAVEAALGLALVGLGIWIAGSLHVDPRPFVQDPSTVSLFPHPADNGFPSDHAAAGGLLTALVVRHRRTLGVLVGIGAVLVAAARVAAHVHHVQDVVAGLLLGLVAGAAGILITRVAAARIGVSTRPDPESDTALGGGPRATGA